MIEWLTEAVASTEPWAQWLVIMLGGAIPYLESYVGAFVGVLVGVNPVLAIAAAIVGNLVTMTLLVLFGEQIRRWRKADQKPETPRRAKLRQRFDKYGVPGVSLLGQTLLPSQVTSMAMVTFGASKRAVLWWQTISIILWGVVFGLLALGLVQATG